MFKGIASFKNTITHISVDNTKHQWVKGICVTFSLFNLHAITPDLPAAYHQLNLEGQMRLYQAFRSKTLLGDCVGGVMLFQVPVIRWNMIQEVQFKYQIHEFDIICHNTAQRFIYDGISQHWTVIARTIKEKIPVHVTNLPGMSARMYLITQHSTLSKVEWQDI